VDTLSSSYDISVHQLQSNILVEVCYIADYQSLKYHVK